MNQSLPSPTRRIPDEFHAQPANRCLDTSGCAAGDRALSLVLDDESINHGLLGKAKRSTPKGRSSLGMRRLIIESRISSAVSGESRIPFLK